MRELLRGAKACTESFRPLVPSKNCSHVRVVFLVSNEDVSLHVIKLHLLIHVVLCEKANTVPSLSQ